jgi:hypothetical protein
MMKTIKLTTQKVISQKPIDLVNQIFLRFYITENQQYGFQFVRFNYNEEIEPIHNSQINWIYGYYSHKDEAESKAQEILSLISA